VSRRSTVLGVLLVLSLGAVAACGPGKPASSVSSLSASPTPTGPKTAPADYVAVSDSSDSTLTSSTVSDKHNVVIGPKFMFETQYAGVVTEIPETSADTLGLPSALKPAPGHEFLVTTLSSSTTYSQTVVDGGRLPGGEAGASEDPDEAVVVDGKVHELTKAVSGSGTIIVSVPTGHKAYLRLTQGGRTQSVDLRTGERVSDPLTPYYPYQEMHHGKTADYWDGTAFPVGVRVSLLDVGGELSPFTPKAGWAAKGKAWIYVNVRVLSICSKNAPECEVTLPRHDFALVLPNGRTVRPRAGQASMTTAATSDISYDPTNPSSKGTGTFGFEVPSSTRKATLSISFAGRVTLVKGKRKLHIAMGRAPGPARVKLTA
jgi:hypothetical protein